MVAMVNKISALLASITAALVLSIGLAAPAFAQSAQDQINNGLCAGSNLQFTDAGGQCAAASGQALSTIDGLVKTAVNLLSAIVGIVAVIMIIVGGLRYVTSGGNDTSVTSAKNTILYAIIGLIIVALAQVLVRFTLSKLTS